MRRHPSNFSAKTRGCSVSSAIERGAMYYERFYRPHSAGRGHPRIIAIWRTAVFLEAGGEGGIRTPDTVARMPHFECGAFNHSATSPRCADSAVRPKTVWCAANSMGKRGRSRAPRPPAKVVLTCRKKLSFQPSPRPGEEAAMTICVLRRHEYSARDWRGGRVVEGARLESVYTGNRIAGSNPAPSASDAFGGIRHANIESFQKSLTRQ